WDLSASATGHPAAASARSSCLLSSYATPRALPSFPTRRSSDLLFIAVIFFWSAFEQAGSTLNLFAERSTRNEAFGIAFPASWFRSEEHTSELQSRENLVCRLLLEKKNARRRDEESRTGLVRTAP